LCGCGTSIRRDKGRRRVFLLSGLLDLVFLLFLCWYAVRRLARVPLFWTESVSKNQENRNKTQWSVRNLTSRGAPG